MTTSAGDGSTIVAGITIPSSDPLFLSIVAVHVVLGLVCAIAGPIAMLSLKGPGRHPTFGKIYFWSLAAIFVSVTALSLMRWTHTYHLFILGLLSFSAALLGRAARRGRWNGWVRVHISGMGASYILLLTAFYVDNGKSIPLWNRLPPIMYWVLPAMIGVPLIFRALLRYSSMRNRPTGE